MGIGMLRRYYPENQTQAEHAAFSKAASALLAEAGVDEGDYDGEATGANGDVLKSDVEAWLEGRGA